MIEKPPSSPVWQPYKFSITAPSRRGRTRAQVYVIVSFERGDFHWDNSRATPKKKSIPVARAAPLLESVPSIGCTLSNEARTRSGGYVNEHTLASAPNVWRVPSQRTHALHSGSLVLSFSVLSSKAACPLNCALSASSFKFVSRSTLGPETRNR